MKVEDYKKEFQDYSGKASDIARQLAFAGVAIVWIFKINTPEGPKVSGDLVLILFLFCISLSLDLFQYMFGYIVWWIHYRYHESKGTSLDAEVRHSEVWPNIMHMMMFGKTVLVFVAYINLVRFLF